MGRPRTKATSTIRHAVLRAYLRKRAFHHLIRQKHLALTVRRQHTRHLHARRGMRGAIVRAGAGIIGFLSDFFGSFIQSAYYYPRHLIAALMLSAGIIGSSMVIYQQIFKDLPSPADLTAKHVSLSTKILDRNGQLLYKIYDDENRTWLPLSKIPKHLVYATIAIEDQDFYFHHGFSVRGIARAVIANYRGESVQGGSTLTQQLVKKRLFSPERTITRKIRELLVSIMVEQTYTKDQILEMYLNQIPYGGSAYGVEEAAQRYFGKSAQNLTLPESALLAGLPVAPSVYTPFGPTPELALQRQHEVLRRMVEDGYITQQDADDAIQTALPLEPDRVPIQAPHFVMYVRHLLSQQYGEDLLNRGGLAVRTTLDLSLQNQVQETVSKEVEALNRLRISNGAALVTNPQTGEILAMVGSTNYFDTAHDGQVNVTLSPRQPGSSIKPLMYSVALERGFTPSTQIEDTPVTYTAEGSPPYTPKNYDGKYHGKPTVRESLASSYNIPAVKTLNSIGIDNFIDRAEALGITTWGDRRRFGLSLTLGGGEVKMTELATAYGAFANHGLRTDLNPILEITDDDGQTLYTNPCSKLAEPSPTDGTNPCKRSQVMQPATAYLLSSILSDNQARTPAFGPLSVLNIPDHEVAVKTGTTNSMRDNWTIGYTSDRLVAVWVGNNDNTPMSYVASGVTGASPIWNKIMVPLLPKNATHAFVKPADVVSVAICPLTNSIACYSCTRMRQEFYANGTQPTGNCKNGRFISETATKPEPTAPRSATTKPGRQTSL